MEKINKLLFGIIGLWMFLAFFFGIFDLEISKYAIIYKNSQWSELGRKYGTEFDTPLLYLAITILLGSIFNDIKMQRRIGFVMILYGISQMQISILTNNEQNQFAAGIMILFLLLFISLNYNKQWRQYIPIAISLILLITILKISTTTMKLIWGRVRFRDLNSDAEFTPWYIINGNGHNQSQQSFPSGHTSAAWSFLPLLFLAKNKNIYKPIKMLLIIGVIGFGLFVAISRVLNGAHYASDVLFSTGIASILTIFLYKLFYQSDFRIKGKEYDVSNSLKKIIFSPLTNQWMGIYLNKQGR
ncbi:MAG: phosphatase PAP2 family protein, partial [Candidatus Hermodarchaeota archaeon]